MEEVELGAVPPASDCSTAVEASVELGELLDVVGRVDVIDFVAGTPSPREGTSAVAVAPIVGAAIAEVAVVCGVVWVVLTVAGVLVAGGGTVGGAVDCAIVVAGCATVVWEAVVVVAV